METRHDGEAVAVVDIAGELTGATEQALMDAYSRAAGPSTQAVVLNFTELDYMNSTGIGLLVTLLVRAQRSNQRILAYGLSDHYRQILALTRLDEAIGIVADEAAAFASAAA